MAKSIKKNYIFNLIYQIMLVVTPLITIPYLSRVLNADGIGEVSFAESVVSFFVLFANLGIGTYGQREISYYQDDRVKRSEVFWNTFILKLIISLSVFIIYLITIFIYFKTTIYIVLSLNILATLFDITWFFQGMEEFGKIVARNIIFKLLSIAFIFLFIKSKNDIVLYAFSIGFFMLLSNLSLYIYVGKYADGIDIKKMAPFKDFIIVLSLFVPTIAIQIYTVLDKTMIGFITRDNFENGYYDLAVRISKILLTIITSLSIAVIPRIGLLYNKKDYDTISDLMYKSYRFVWLIGTPLCLGLIALSNNFVPWFLGNGYDRVTLLVKILSFLIIAIGINNITGVQYLIPTKRQNLFTLSVMLGAILNLCLNLFLIRKYMSVGAAVASIIAESFIALFQLYMVRKEISFKRVLAEGINYYIAGLLMFAVTTFMSKSLRATVYNSLLIMLVGALIYFTIIFLLKDSFVLENISSIYSKICLRFKKDGK